MKFGYFNQLQMPKPWPENAEVQLYKDAMAEAVLAEEVGFEYYWQTEHHFYPEIGHSSAPELFLAALAQHTSKIRLGLGVVVLPCNHPFRVVEYVSTLDVLSGGRVELGTGRGASVYHSEAFGYDAEGAKELWDESIQIIASMFVNDPFPGWKGTHYDLAPTGPGAQARAEAPPPNVAGSYPAGDVRQGGADGSRDPGVQRHRAGEDDTGDQGLPGRDARV